MTLTSKWTAPECRKCGKTGASAYFRRSTTPGLWLCRDKTKCKQRVKEQA